MPAILPPPSSPRSVVGSSRGPWDGAWALQFRHREANGWWYTCAPTVGGLVGAWFPPPPPTEKPRRGTGEFTCRPAGSLVRRVRWGSADGGGRWAGRWCRCCPGFVPESPSAEIAVGPGGGECRGDLAPTLPGSGDLLNSYSFSLGTPECPS
ncbi:hypothetical protein HJG60_010665 [Phyllostomus discolor]|uniref:Uncharacterized protein n=1 Tax=Phyllostomus discolor TaxID=89673 RepID=A0A834EF12_9CHIR|nr:hypothetical protein HJG60_010665 [Phyllostomus discolor]